MNDAIQIGVYVLIAIAVLGLLFVVGYGIKAIFLPVKTVTNQIDAASDVIDKTYTADNAIYNYEWFKTQYEKIQANRDQIIIANNTINDFKSTYGEPTTWSYINQQEYARLLSIKQGLQSQDKNLVAEYNARSNMANRVIFKDNLPLHVDELLW
jgi:hypothetical protein